MLNAGYEFVDFKIILLYNKRLIDYYVMIKKFKESYMKKSIFNLMISMIVFFAVLLTVSVAYAQDDMQEAKASFLGAGVKFKMDRPSMKARNLESSNSEQVKEAKEFKHMDNGLLSGAFGGNGGAEGVRSRPIKDTKILCEVCKAKAVLYSNENCEFCKGKSYADLCDKCIAWSILNACDECKARIRGKVGKKEAVSVDEAADDEKIEISNSVSEEITADEVNNEKMEVKAKTKVKKSASRKNKNKKAVKTEAVEESIE